MAKKTRTKQIAKKIQTKRPDDASYVAVNWQEPSEVGMNYGTFLEIEKHAAPKTPRGAAGEAVASDARFASAGPRTKLSFRRGRIWA